MKRNTLLKYCVVVVLLCIVVLSSNAAGASTTKYGSCEKPYLQHGTARIRSRGRFVKYTCFTGYQLYGDKYNTCVKGQWEGNLPKCVRATCKPVSPPVNGITLASPVYGGAVLTFFCNPGYVLHGNNMVHCDGTNWDNVLPTCLKNGTLPTPECDFERQDLCGWTHDLNHNFDWKRQNLNTPSGHVGTGPSFDHTFGVGHTGYYMYTESSSRAENDTARLFSPLFPASPTITCFEFYYHMLGRTTGHLRVFVKPESMTFSSVRTTPLFNKYGNQGDHWFRGTVPIKNITEPYQIIFEALNGPAPGYLSDIAIDDVKLLEKCDTDQTTTETQYEESTTAESQTELQPSTTDLTGLSCNGRCSESQRNESSGIDCQCFPDCRNDNSCCPDFIALCVLLDMTTDSWDSVASQEYRINTISTLAKSTVTSTTSIPTTKVTTTKPTTKIAATTMSSIKILHTISPTTKLNPTKIIATTQSTKTNEITTVRNKIPVSRQTTESDEVIISRTIEPDDMDNEIPHSELSSEQYSSQQVVPQADNSDTFSIVITVLECIGLFCVCLAIILVTYYYKARSVRSQRGSCFNFNRNRTDSISDVRFLASDEMLDFTMAQCNQL